jgi:hypothetical protein
MPISNSNVNFNVKFQFQSNSNVNFQFQFQFQCQCQFSIQFQSNFNVNCNSPIQCLCLCLCQCQFSIQINVNLLLGQQKWSCQFFNSNQCQFTLNLLLGQQKWSCLFSNQVNNNLPSIGILLSQTFNWYLIAGQVPGSIQKRTTCTCLYTYASGQTAKFDRTVCIQLMLCYQSDGKFNLKNSLYPAYALLSVKRQVRSKRTVCTLPHDVLIIQQASSIRRNSLYQPFCLCLQPNSQFNPKEQFVSAYLFVSPIKCQVRSKEPLASAYMSMFPVKCQVQSQEQLAPISCIVSPGQVTSSTQRTTCTLPSTPWFVYPVNVYLNPQ